MKKVWMIAVIGLLVALLLAAGIFWMVDRSRFEDFMQEGIHEYHGYTRLDFEDTVYFFGKNDMEAEADSGEAGTFSVSGIIQPSEDGSMRVFLGSLNLSRYPLPLENSRNTFKAIVQDGLLIIYRRVNLEGDDYEGYTYWAMISEEHPELYAIYIYEDGENIANAYPGKTEEEALANRDAFWKNFGKENPTK